MFYVPIIPKCSQHQAWDRALRKCSLSKDQAKGMNYGCRVAGGVFCLSTLFRSAVEALGPLPGNGLLLPLCLQQ